MKVTRDMKEQTALFMPFVASSLIFPHRNSASVENNGTMSFIDTGAVKIGVTCEHVYRAFERAREQDSTAMLKLVGNGTTLNISDRPVISRSRTNPDLITLELGDLDVIGKQYYREEIDWPPAKPTKGDTAFFAGFPEGHRVPGRVRLATVLDTVVSVSDQKFVLADEAEDRRIGRIELDLPPINSFSGVSGCACYTLARTSGAEFRLSGFIYEEGNFDPDNNLLRAIFCCCHASAIACDGNIL